ncbi:uncharacterized protein MELLADRAFT_71731 [Melampsora larici-populina 98AG31]|uniref:Zn(2)-C6 fungal-type domain-containing protein n=1 Tax=Melampsora larici-populina (strain 98AG31 / pathotype 3-4-7) TaxID=747676 RepID=F4RJX0_MELLP|nr:uncharacterized protein MELLADRAFT_71731 [Melampsora larici-populina 98AG31]EGG07422.1 hypothetical protein MELLADRAFT_71731 [Melampsora larici-populina 98AG31]
MSGRWLSGGPLPELDQLALSPPSSHVLSNHQSSKSSDARFNSHSSLGSSSTAEQPIILSREMMIGARSDQCCSTSPNSQQLIPQWPNTFSTDSGLFDRNRDDHRKRKRNRTMQSCLPCHTNKRKCVDCFFSKSFFCLFLFIAPSLLPTKLVAWIPLSICFNLSILSNVKSWCIYPY